MYIFLREPACVAIGFGLEPGFLPLFCYEVCWETSGQLSPQPKPPHRIAVKIGQRGEEPSCLEEGWDINVTATGPADSGSGTLTPIVSSNPTRG